MTSGKTSMSNKQANCLQYEVQGAIIVSGPDLYFQFAANRNNRENVFSSFNKTNYKTWQISDILLAFRTIFRVNAEESPF